MHYPIKFDTSVEINSLTDLPRLKIILEAANLKPNISKIARDMSCDRRTAKRYYEGKFPSGKRAKPSYLDVYYDEISKLLGPDSIQIFYYNRLWRYLCEKRSLIVLNQPFEVISQTGLNYKPILTAKKKYQRT